MFDESIINIIGRVLYDPFRETIFTLKNQLTIDYQKTCDKKYTIIITRVKCIRIFEYMCI
jgi:hypothetical protein